MIRTYKFLLRPTVRQAQAQALAEMLRDHCSLYNAALQERRDAYRHSSKTSVTYGMQSAQLKDIRAFDPERQGRWSFSSQQATLRRLDKAMQAFFRRGKSGETPGYPRFRGVNWFDTVDFPKDGDGCRWKLHLPHLPRMRAHRQGEPAHPGKVPLPRLRPPRARRHRGSHQRSTGRAGPSQRQPGVTRSPRLQLGEESQVKRKVGSGGVREHGYATVPLRPTGSRGISSPSGA